MSKRKEIIREVELESNKIALQLLFELLLKEDVKNNK